MANQITIDIGAAANDGTGDPLRTAFNYVNNNFSNVWNTGLPNSNVQFSDNRILTVNTNANLVLSPNGIGKVASNVDIVPNTANVFGLGSPTRRWNTVYTQYLDVSNDTTFNNLTVNGNLTVQGNIVMPPGSSLVGNGASPAPNISGFSSATFGADVTATGNISGGNILGNGSSMTGVATKTTGSWTVTSGTNTYSFTVPVNGVYQLWVNGNIANGIIAYNATVSVTNSNVPVIGQQFAWNYEGAGNPILITSIPAQIIGTAGAISNASPSVGTTTNTFDFGINNSSGGDVTVYWGYTKIS